MKIEKTKVFNFDGAIRGMRNPMNSWEKSDSWFGLISLYDEDILTDIADAWIQYYNEDKDYYELLDKYICWLTKEGILDGCSNCDVYDVAFLGPNDLTLARKLVLAGSEHAKFMRQIYVSVDITAPLYW